MKLKADFNQPAERKWTLEYQKCRSEMSRIQYHIKKTEGEERARWINEYKQVRAKLLKTPCKSQTDKKIKYVRYADDFLIGVNGNRYDCTEIKGKLTQFIGKELKMELSDRKTLITHSNQYARFLGYNIRIRRDDKIKHGGAGNGTQRTLNNMTELSVPFAEKIHKFIFSKGIARQKKDGTLFPVHRAYLTKLTDLEIVSVYSANLRGICNYYCSAANFNKLAYLAYLMEYSCLKTLANKHKSKISSVVKMFKDGKGEWGIPYETKQGLKRYYFVKFSDCKGDKFLSDKTTKDAAIYLTSRNSLKDRLKAKVCELCGTTKSNQYELHHIHKVKDLKGKALWGIAMIVKRRKTLVVCKACHNKIHHPKSSS